ncbi:uncharacterized protein A1O9_11451 [Exophiala aquamarina CBS 119918]|uniref:PIN domain-containing protein n=1 Tax=Exophiala aquamarina CBS 119918 TaxID=1182545 RepID=A0A072P019_9EURO|nr:uncharacterized protein A1O9_11451 [Exophiala aquamarina CBS 119918]KEF52608.1 hypothetical protein A1O9_11451 [Exophiala aquamarina CBS 119918]
MSPQPVIRCLVDDTILTRNISEIEPWVSQGALILVVPLYTLERLRILKKDSSQIGQNARKAVKFLDKTTSSRGDLPHDPVILQGPDDQYPTWAEVEAHYINDALKTNPVVGEDDSICTMDTKQEKDAEVRLKETTPAGGALSQLLLDKLNFAKDPNMTSPTSTPPLSPSSSGLQSSKTSPEVKSASIVKQDQAPVPPSLKPLLNPVVWYMHENKATIGDHFFLLTNSADTIHLARDFGIPTKNIHQLRSALGLDESVGVKNGPKREERSKKEQSKPAPRPEVKTLFSYDDIESDDEEVVFKPRGRGSGSAPTVTASRPAAPSRARKGKDTRSPRTSFSTPVQPAAQTQPQIPIEEIDPDSFDRGSFGRGSTPLVNVSSHTQGSYNSSRGSGYRGNHGQNGRGGAHSRGGGRGMERGSARGKGRLFVP